METTLRQTVSCSQNTPELKRAKTYSALSFDRINFSTSRICFQFLGDPLLCAIISWANKNFLFWRLSNNCQIARPAVVSGPPNWKKPYNKHLINLVLSVCTVNYGSFMFFFSLIYGLRASRLGLKSMEKNSVRNLQHKPKTRLISGMYTWMAIFIWLKWGVSIWCVYPWAEPPFVHFFLPSNVEENRTLIA